MPNKILFIFQPQIMHKICLGLHTIHYIVAGLRSGVKEHLFYLFGVLQRFQHCTGHITTGSWKARGNQDIQLVKVLYRKLLTNGKQLPAFPLEVEA